MPNGQDVARRLADLLREPRETLEVELKNWLDIVGSNEHKATLAKELIALANHGGGYVVFGFDETGDGVVPAAPMCYPSKRRDELLKDNPAARSFAERIGNFRDNGTTRKWNGKI